MLTENCSLQPQFVRILFGALLLIRRTKLRIACCQGLTNKQTNKQTTVVWLTVADSNHKLNIRTGRVERKGSNTQYSSARYGPFPLSISAPSTECIMFSVHSRPTAVIVEQTCILCYWELGCWIIWCLLLSYLLPFASPLKVQWWLTICTTCVNIKKSALCPYSVSVCFIWFSQYTATVSPNSINRLVSAAET
jgi:hypothetical protein